MSAERTDQPDTTTGERQPVEQTVERWATYWGRAFVDAWRTVFPPREDYL